MPTIASPRRCEELWFDGGNLVIRAEGVVFKVLAAQLSIASSVFKDMLGVPQPPRTSTELYEGLPFVFLPDSAFEVTHFLKGIVIPGYADHEVSQRFAVLAALLRMGTKYSVAYFRRLAISKLTTIFPSEWAMHLACDGWHARQQHIADWVDVAKYAVLALARECNVPVVVPSILLDITPLQGRTLDWWKHECDQCFISEDGHEYRLDASTQLQCIVAGWALQAEKQDILDKLVQLDHCEGSAAKYCSIQAQHLLRDLLLDIRGVFLFCSVDDLREQWQIEQWARCDDCTKQAGEEWSEKMEALWSKLPSYFELGTWDELRAQTQM